MSRIIKNNILILNYIVKYGKTVIGLCFVSIIIELFSNYIGLSLGRWIFDNATANNISTLLIVIVSVACFSFFCNFLSQLVNVYKVQFENIDISYAMMRDICKSAFDIGQNQMENPEFYNKYVRAISETGVRAKEVLSTLRGICSGVLSLLLALYLVININLTISFSLLISSIIGTLIINKANGIEYNQFMDNSINERKYGYLIRLIFQPEYSKAIRLDGQGINELLQKYLNENKSNSFSTIKKYISKLFRLFTIKEIGDLIFLKIIPWVLIAYNLCIGYITVGEASVLLSAISMLPSIYSTIFNSFISVRKNSLYIDNFRDIIDEAEVNRNKQADLIYNIDKGMDIAIKQVSFNYYFSKLNDYILYKINLQINHGEKVALVGENGAGKTTLAMLISGLYSASEGEININGININHVKRNELREKVAVMTQETKLYSFTIAENILMRTVKSQEDYDLVREALEKVGLLEKVLNSKYQYDSYISREFEDEGIELSGGEKQRLALARIYVGNAECVILDEPTSALDSYSEKKIIDLMMNLLSDRTVILISHRLSAIRMVNRIFYLHKGQIVEEGNHKKLLLKKEYYYNLYMAQISQYQLEVKERHDDKVTN